MRSVFLLLICLLFSCKNEESYYENSNNTIDTLTTNSFEYKYKNKQKYFMKFWKGMTQEEFTLTKKQMKKEGLIDLTYDKDGIFYDLKIGESYINFEPILEKDIVIGLTISDVNEEIYKLYEQKYNLPKLVDISIVGQCYKEVNPCFLKDDCEDFLKINKNIKEVSFNEVKQNTDFNKSSHIYIRKGLPDDRIELRNDKCNIIVRSNIYSSYIIPITSIIYGHNHSRKNTDFYYPNNDNFLESLEYSLDKKSRFRYVVTYQENSINISYYPNDYLSEQEVKQNKESQKQKDIQKEKEKKLNKLLKEI